VARAAAVALAALTFLAAGAPAAAARWEHPVRLLGRQANEILPAQIGFSDHGAAAVASGVQNEQSPASSSAFVTLRSAKGAFGRARLVPHALQVLDLAFAHSTLWLLTGSAPGDLACCATVTAVPVPAAGGGGFGAGRRLVGGLTGTTDGQLVALSGGGLLAAIATQRGVWEAQSGASGSFGPTKRLSFGGSPTDLAATSLSGGGGVIAWADAVGGGETGAGRILITSGTATAEPSRVRVAATVPSGYSIDELALAPGAHGPTVAWVQSWYDARGLFHSAVMEQAPPGPAVMVSQGDLLASDLSLAGEDNGDRVLSWEACSAIGTCEASAALSPRHKPFGPPVTLGASDPTQAPAAAISAAGKALVAWVGVGGDPVAAAGGRHAGGFGHAQTISSTDYATAPAVAFGPAGGALAAWTQGTLAPEVIGAWNGSP
jgi:hypothetical protein